MRVRGRPFPLVVDESVVGCLLHISSFSLNCHLFFGNLNMPRGMVIIYLSYVAHKHTRLTLFTVLALLMKFCRGSCGTLTL